MKVFVKFKIKTMQPIVTNEEDQYSTDGFDYVEMTIVGEDIIDITEDQLHIHVVKGILEEKHKKKPIEITAMNVLIP